MRTKHFLLAFLLTSPFFSMGAQSLWTTAEMKAKIVDGLNGFIEGEYRTQNELSGTSRWAGTIGLDYKVCSSLKFTGGYSYIHQKENKEITKKWNIIPSYWQPKHRGFFAVTGSYEWNRFTFSLRERYQYTYRTEQSVPKFASDGVTPKNDELISGKGKHILRSRIQAEYNIKGSKFAPFLSYELYNSLQDGFAADKARYTIGTDYAFNKKHSVSLYYRYIDQGDDEESAGHIIGVGYKFKL